MATHSSTLARKIQWTEERSRLLSPWGCKESDTTERLHFTVSLFLWIEEMIIAPALPWGQTSFTLSSLILVKKCCRNTLEFKIFLYTLNKSRGFPGGASGKEPACQCRRHKRNRFDPWVGKIPWRRAWQSIPVFLLENPMDRGAWQATVHRVAKNQTRLKQPSTKHAILVTVPKGLRSEREESVDEERGREWPSKITVRGQVLPVSHLIPRKIPIGHQHEI